MTTPPVDLYPGVILEHARHPRNAGPLPGATHVACADNPFCGDRCTVALRLEAGHIAGARFEGVGCAISTASASMMTVAIDGLSCSAALVLAERLERLLEGDPADGDAAVTTAATALGDLGALASVRRFRVRVKCARLPWQAMRAALTGAPTPVAPE